MYSRGFRCLGRLPALRARLRRVAALAAPFPLKAVVALGDEVYVLLLPTAAFGAGVRVGDEPDGAVLAPFAVIPALTVPVAVGVIVQAVGAEAVDHSAFM